MFICKKEIKDIGNSIMKEIKNDGYSYILEKLLIENSILTNYETLQTRFNSNNVSYSFSSLKDLEKIYGYRIELVEGYNALDNFYKDIFDKNILKFINSSGLSYKIYKLPRKIELEVKKNRFKVYTLEIDTFYYLDFNGGWY